MDYKINKEDKINKYRLSIYFFIPASLQISSKSYPKNKFYTDKTNYIRFKTPKMAISTIINKKNKLSPFYRIESLLTKIEEGTAIGELEKDFLYEIRLSGAILKSSLRDQVKHFITEFHASETCEDVIIHLSNYIEDIEELEKRIATIGSQFHSSQISENLRAAFSLAEQFISLQIQDNLTLVLKELPEKIDCTGLRNKIIDLIEKQIKYRKSKESKLIRNHSDKNESYVYWEGLLKKFTQAVLYLRLKDKDEASKISELLFSIAAGFAMFFSLLIGLWVANFFSEDSMPFIFALVIAYMLKDRIKENLRGMSKKAMGFIFPDNVFDIIDSTSEKKLGHIKETMKFLDWKDLRPEVNHIRMSSAKHEIEHEGKPETIFRYSKEVKLKPKEITRMHQRNIDIHDIIRFNVRNFIQYADDPVRFEEVYNSETKQIEKVECLKVYHLNIVLRMEYVDDHGVENITFKKVRVVLTQNGIKGMSEPSFTI
jgi:hypothetical protein